MRLTTNYVTFLRPSFALAVVCVGQITISPAFAQESITENQTAAMINTAAVKPLKTDYQIVRLADYETETPVLPSAPRSRDAQLCTSCSFSRISLSQHDVDVKSAGNTLDGGVSDPGLPIVMKLDVPAQAAVKNDDPLRSKSRFAEISGFD